MKRMLILMAALLAGCAMSPNEMRERGTLAEFNSQRTAIQVVRCIAGKAERLQAPVQWREGERAGAYDMQVIYPSMVGFMLVAEVAPAGSGSSVKAWLTPNTSPADTRAQLLTGCD